MSTKTIEATLLTSFPAHALPRRLDEYNECLERNCRHENIAKIILFYEGSEEDHKRFAYKHTKIETIFINKWASLNQLLDYGNECVRGSYVMIANADIYFDDESDLHRIVEMRKGSMWALSRYDYDMKKKKWKILVGYDIQSYDTYIFQSPLKKFNCRNLCMGIGGCDSYFVSKAVAGGISVANPAISTVSKHLHYRSSHTSPHRRSEKRQKNSYQDCKEYNSIVDGRAAVVSAIEDKNYRIRHNAIKLIISHYKKKILLPRS